MDPYHIHTISFRSYKGANIFKHEEELDYLSPYTVSEVNISANDKYHFPLSLVI